MSILPQQYRARTFVALALTSVGVAVFVGSSASLTSSSSNPTNTFTAGNLAHSNSRDGAAILTVSLMRPGDSASGTVVITNTGDIPGMFFVDESNVSDTPGANGGGLSDVLTVRIEDITGAPSTVYEGSIKGMPGQALGSFAVGEARTYRFTVTFPDGGVPPGDTTGDNAYKGSSLSVQYDWVATT